MKHLSILLFLLLSINLFAQEENSSPVKKYKYAVGVFGNHKVLGIQLESMIYKNFAIKIGGSKIFGYNSSNEFGFGMFGAISYYIPINSKVIEPVIGLGGVYSMYHWDVGFDSGNLNDFNIGGGIGINFRLSNKMRVGINVFAANSFKTDYNYETENMEITERNLLILPALTFDYLF